MSTNKEDRALNNACAYACESHEEALRARGYSFHALASQQAGYAKEWAWIAYLRAQRDTNPS